MYEADREDIAFEPADPDGRGRGAVRILVRLLLVAVLLWLIVAAGIGGLGALNARAGADRIRDLDFSVGVGELVDGDVDAELEAARDDFDAADGHLGNPVLAPAKLLPVVGRQLRSASALASSAAEVLDASGTALESLRAEIGDGTPGENDRVASLGRLRAELRVVDGVLADVDLGPSEALVGPLHDARVEVSERLIDARTRITDVLAIADGVHALLEGPSRYLVLAANNAEMRVGSAMALSVGTLDLADGRAAVAQEFEPAGDLLLPEPVALPDELAALWGWSTLGADYRSLALSARFPSNAELATQMWSSLGRGAVDGVLLIDVEGIAALLRIAGPVEVDGQMVSADDVAPFLLRDQYADQELDDLEANDERRDRLRVLAAAALEALGDADLDLRTMLDELRSARDGRHLLFWSPDAEAQTAWETVGVDGELDPHSLLVGVANFDNSKLDPYIATTVSASAIRDGDDALVDLAIEVANDSPADLPGYAAGDDGGSTYRGLVSAHLPGSATDLDLVGFDGRAALGRDGPTVVIAARVDVLRGEPRRGNLRFRIPLADLRVVRVLPSARTPGVAWSVGDVSWIDGSPQAWPPHVP